jgi:hypothetical protein
LYLAEIFGQHEESYDDPMKAPIRNGIDDEPGIAIK